MSDVAYLPPALRHRIQRLKGFRKNSLQTPSQTTGTFSANSQIRITLPPRSIIDLGSVNLKFDLTLTPGSSGIVSAPRYAQSFFRKVELLVAGKAVCLASLNEYGDAFNAIGNVIFGPEKQRELALFELGGDVPTTGIAGTGYTAGQNINYSAATTLRVNVSNWLGMLSSGLTKYLPTQIMGSTGVELRITLMDNTILPATVSGATFSIQNVYLNCDVISFEDDLYEQSLARVWEHGDPVRLPFKDWYDYQSSTATNGINATFSTSSGSIDSIWTVLRATSYNTQANVNTNSLTSDYFTFQSGSDYGATGASQLSNVGTYQYTINGVQYPQFQATADDVYTSLLKTSTLNSGSNPHYTNNIASQAQWYNGKFVFPISLELNEKGNNPDLVSSGMSSEGANIPIVAKIQSTNLGSGFSTSHFVETTSELLVFPGESIVLKQ